MEADLAFRGIDMRDMYRPGCDLTPRRLLVLIRGLPAEAPLWDQIRVADERADKQRVEAKIRERTDYYKRRKEVAEA